ncbi:F-box protein GID2 [Cardamine amara subsp. amara]|uniref:F-box protein GID2 n=1 Tax=Cardamine amara subsp. amara TaxID=228776 RepID=A0ABD1BZ90_CARAN
MKRSATNSLLDGDAQNEKNKKMKSAEEEEDSEIGFSNLDENLVYEVLKHVDARTLAMSSCVSKIWHKTAQDERLWELICTRHWVNIGCGKNQLRSVVLALGGFRRLHSLYLWPLSNPNPRARFGKDELKLSLSLLSIRYFEKMSFTKKGGSALPDSK